MKTICPFCERRVRLRFFPFAVSLSSKVIGDEITIHAHVRCLLELAFMDFYVRGRDQLRSAEELAMEAVKPRLKSEPEVFVFTDPSRRIH